MRRFEEHSLRPGGEISLSLEFGSLESRGPDEVVTSTVHPSMLLSDNSYSCICTVGYKYAAY